MRICSWDVGIKNLAYCIIEKDKDAFKIKEWDIINLVNSDDKCSKCKSKVKYIVNSKGYCEKHKKQGPKFDDYFVLCENERCVKCKKNAKYEKDDIYYCKIHAKQLLNNLYKPIKIKCYNQSIQTLGENMYNKLNKIKFDVDEVLIENQPTLKNPMMKTIAMLLFSYFIFKKQEYNISNIKFISPSNKLKIKKESKKLLIDCKSKSEKYKLTKQLGRQYTNELIDDNEKELLNAFDKKDDLCDAFLQGYHYLFFT